MNVTPYRRRQIEVAEAVVECHRAAATIEAAMPGLTRPEVVESQSTGILPALVLRLTPPQAKRLANRLTPPPPQQGVPGDRR